MLISDDPHRKDLFHNDHWVCTDFVLRIDFKIRTIELVQIWDTAAYYRGAMGILLISEIGCATLSSTLLIMSTRYSSETKPTWIKAKKAVPTSRGQALADEYGIKFFETSAKTNLNVEEVFFSVAKDIKQQLAETDSKAEPQTIRSDQAANASQPAQNTSCCGS
ncbi:hypothetical protein MLD38_018953 [Melastoma candidum]|uniref:Uncharacterized protein n=1 Tax=Melastoma candidum TaxID=119954 RepID=A0ACB9QVC3_9MYRT|nr:hypothetical protein MLD38_018953 [Melastoma candidum]